MTSLSPLQARAIYLLSLLLLLITLVSCGGSSSSTSGTLTKITLTPATVSIPNGQQTTFFAAPTDANGNALTGLGITWTSSATNVATISDTGVAIGKAPGTTQITASVSGITSNSATLTVTTNVARVVITPATSAVGVNGTQQFSATALDPSGNPISGVSFSWFCSFSGIATIDQNGLATGAAPGTVTIVANVGSVTSQPATLTVNAP